MDLKIFDFFDNDDFVECNVLKKFSDEDKVAIVIRSELTSLNDKFEYLYNICDTCSNKLRANILDWIRYQKEIVKSLCKINGEALFIVNFDEYVFDCKIYSTLNSALKNSPFYTNKMISINGVDNNRNGGIVYLTSYRYVDSDDIFDKIAVCKINNRSNLLKINGLKNNDLYEHIVELNGPYKSFDMVYSPSYCDMLNTFVVADRNDPYVMKIMKEKHREPKIGEWLKLNVPNYYLETNPCRINGVNQGELLGSFVHEYERCSLNRIKIYKNNDLKVYQVNYINEIKKQLSNRVIEETL